jgi:hypothetical protein
LDFERASHLLNLTVSVFSARRKLDCQEQLPGVFPVCFLGKKSLQAISDSGTALVLL